MEHLRILAFFVVLLVGLTSTVYVFLVSRSDHRPGVRTLRWFLIGFGVVVLVNLTSVYACANLLHNCLLYRSSVFPDVLGTIGRVAYLVMVMSVVLIALRMRGSGLGGLGDTELFLRAAPFFAGYAVLSALGRSSPALVKLVWIDLGLFVAAYVVLLGTLAALALHGAGLSRPRRREAGAIAFGTANLILFVVFLFTFTMPNGPAFALNVPAMFLIALFPLLWLRRYRPAAVTNGNGNVLESLDLDTILAPLGVSAREREIAACILAGKSNKEIEDELFISASTVKNHIYRLFRKLGVQSRTQLINWILHSQAADTAS